MQNQTAFSHPSSRFRLNQSLVIGAKEKLAANFTLFLGCFLAGLSTGSLRSCSSGASKEAQGGRRTAAATQEEPEAEAGFSLFTGISMFSSWLKIIISEAS